MKNWNNCIVDKLKYITIAYIPQVESVKLMIQEHYDIPEYDDTLFMVNTLGVCQLEKDDFPQQRKIYYNLEHANDMLPHEKFFVADWCKDFGVTEIWSMEPNCETIDTDLGIVFMPLRYTSLLGKSGYCYTKGTSFDLGFVGVVGSYELSPRRNDFFDDYIKDGYDFSIKILNGSSIMDTRDEFRNCRFILDTHRNYRQTMQNQVRIFENVCLGNTVLSEKSAYNVFPGLIYEWEDMDELDRLVKTLEPQDFSEQYKEMTYTNDAYNKYRDYIITTNYTNKTSDYFNAVRVKRMDIINWFIDNFEYKSYLEIGVADGECLYSINPTGTCWKVGVDPDPNSVATCHMPSDEFFSQLENGAFDDIGEDFKFDIIFIDGLHLWEQCYNDIVNALNHLAPNGVILCHDMNPLEEMYQSRTPSCGLWNGDVWKAFVKIRMERSDIYTCMVENVDHGLGFIKWGSQQPIELDKPFDELLYDDFCKQKKFLMNTVNLDEFVDQNGL